MKATRKRPGKRGAWRFRDYMDANCFHRAEDLAAASGVSISTVYRAMRGDSISQLALLALADPLSATTDELESAIEHSAPGKKRRTS